jgi:beta-aspartyl-peptidase (threonine type)
MNVPACAVVLLLSLFVAAVAGGPAESPGDVVLAIHGGAGVVNRSKVTPEREKGYRAALETALKAGYQAMQREGGTGLDAVEAAIRVMEDSPLFNAGKGAVFTHEGRNELDASIMEGKDKRAGAVAGVTCIRNPITAARAVMEKSKHVFLVGRGADLFATEQGLEVVDPSYYWTRQRWVELQKALEKEKKAGGQDGPRGAASPPAGYTFGTVGAVARDRQGILAAGTSTGGMTNKRSGRVGDSPVIGAGTYADNQACAVSGTGHGEIFIRYAVAHEIAALVKYKNRSVAEAADEVLGKLPTEPGGVGGVIVLDARGNLAMRYNTEGMYRGYVTADGQVHVTVYDK